MKKRKKKKRLTPCGAIHKYCMIRCMQTGSEVKNCDDKKCPLYRFRMANNPNRQKSHLTPSQVKRDDSGKFKPLYNGKKQPKIIGLSKKGKLRIKLPSGEVLKIDVQGQTQIKKRG